MNTTLDVLNNATIVSDHDQFMDFKTAKVQSITMDQLRKTYKETDVYTGRPLSGIYHFDFFDQVSQIANQIGYQTEYYDIFAAQNRDGKTPGVTLCPQFEQQYGERAVEAHTLRRVFANIRIKDFDTDELTTNLAVAFHQRGIQVGFGNNVKICHNQCMLNKDKYAATYGERGAEKYDINGILEVIKSWFLDARHIVETDRERIERMKNIKVSADETLRMIGILTSTRVKRDSKYFKEDKDYPLNQAQISDWTEDLLIRYDKEGQLCLWDWYDAATNLYKATSLDMPLVMPMNRKMVEFLEEQYTF